MTLCVFKYNAPRYSHFAVALPRNATFRSVQVQGVDPVMWYEVDPSEPPVTRSFQWIATGEFVPDESAYLGTCQFEGGALVYHLYQVERK